MILTVNMNASIDKRYLMVDCQLGMVNRVKQCVSSAGGKGLNVARVAVALGETVMAAGFLRGYAGQHIAERIKEQGILNCCVQILGESRSCINIFDEKTGIQTEFLEPGDPVCEKDIERFLDSYCQLAARCDVVTISGSVPPGTDRNIYAHLVEVAKNMGIPVLLDTSGDLFSLAVEVGPDFIKPNLDELQEYEGRTLKNEEEIIQAGIRLQKKGIGTAVISMGEKGSLAVAREGVFKITVPSVESINTVGCGDAMLAGLAVGTAGKLSLMETLKLAAAVSAATAMCEETGYFVREDMELLMEKIVVQRI